MLNGARGVVIAVSGGADSVALLDILVRIVSESEQNKEIFSPAGAFAPGSGFNLHIAHLDHMLRGSQSTEDAEFVSRLGAQLRISVTIDRVDVGAAAKASGKGIEEAAREIRYSFLLATAQKLGYDRIAVGHT